MLGLTKVWTRPLNYQVLALDLAFPTVTHDPQGRLFQLKPTIRGVEWSNAGPRRNSTNLACYPTHHHHLSSALAESSSSPKHLGLETTRCRNGMETSWKIRQDKRGFKRGQIWKTNKHEKHLMTKDKNINLHQSWKKKTNCSKQFAK